MLVIFGTRVIGKTIKGGVFQCPRCNCERNYVLKQNKKFFSLFFIPFIPLKDIGNTLECTFCKTPYVPNASIAQDENNFSAGETDTLSKPLAAVGKRLGAYIIDMIFLVFLNFPLAFAVKYLPTFFHNKFYLVFFLLWIIYFFAMELFFKGTIGKKMLSIETISDDEERPVNVIRYFLRSVVKSIAFINVVVLFNDKHKGCHDFIANTVVVEK